MIIHENSKSIVTLKNNVVIKYLKYTKIDKYWLYAYNQLSKKKSMYVKVLDIIDEQTYTMEYIPNIICTVEDLIKNSDNYHLLEKTEIINISSLLPSIFLETLNYSKSLPDDKYFIHTDPLLSNFVFTKSKKIVVIDPDSFTFVDNLDYIEKYYMSSINVMYNIQKIFYFKSR